MYGAPNRIMWFTVVFAFLGSVVMYGAMAWKMEAVTARQVSESLVQMRLPIMCMAVFCLVLSVLWSQLKLTIPAEVVIGSSRKLQSAGRFLTHTLIALALAEAVAIFGLLLFFLGASLADFLMLAAPSAAVMVIFIIPKGIVYWNVHESLQEE